MCIARLLDSVHVPAAEGHTLATGRFVKGARVKGLHGALHALACAVSLLMATVAYKVYTDPKTELPDLLLMLFGECCPQSPDQCVTRRGCCTRVWARTANYPLWGPGTRASSAAGR